MIVFIMRGPSGSGKSNWIHKHHPEAAVCSADDFFLGDEGEYIFDPSKMAEAHQECFQAFLMSLHLKNDVTIVDNTNLRWWEYMNYVTVANMCGAAVYIIQFVPRMIEELKLCFERAKHGTPPTIVSMQGWNFEQPRLHHPSESSLFRYNVESLTIMDAGQPEMQSQRVVVETDTIEDAVTLHARVEADGWIIECESPLELRHEDGSFATGQAAELVLESYRVT